MNKTKVYNEDNNDLGIGLRDVPDVHISFPYKNIVFDLYITSIE